MRTSLPSAAAPLMFAALAMPAFGQDAEDGARSLDRRTQEIKESAEPAVVFVTVTTRANPLPRLAFPGLVIAPTSQQAERVEGTGFFVASRGLFVTTDELVRDAERIEVRFADGTTRDATLVGIDRPFRMAVLRTTPSAAAAPLPHAQRVEALPSTIGWFLGAAAAHSASVPTVDVQVASVRPVPAEGAAYDRFLYAPISIARGAAGGPLVGGDGNLLGMAVGSLVAREENADPGVRMRFPRATLFVRGDDIADAAQQIAANGRVDRPMIGALMESGSNRIDTLFPGSPAEAAGLAEGDSIVRVGCLPVGNYADLSRALLRRHAGEPVKMTIERAGERLTRLVTLAPFSVPPAPTKPPIPGAVIEVSLDPLGDEVYKIVEVAPDTLAAKAGIRPGDRLLSVDGRCTHRFLQRHQARPSVLAPTKVEVRRDGTTLELALPSE